MKDFLNYRTVLGNSRFEKKCKVRKVEYLDNICINLNYKYYKLGAH